MTVVFTLSTLGASAQMVIDNTQTPQQLVQDVLLGQGVVVTNIQFTGDQSQIGYFDATNANFPIPEGIVMSSGDVTDIPAPGGTFASTVVGEPGDADLDVVSSAGTNDAVVLQFDFVPTGDSIQFDYIFGSEEYPEFVNAGFNDVFAFIISGPGFNGPFANGGENIALIPGTVTPVTIDNVNDGLNSQYYIDNAAGGADGIVYDGYTVTLTALAQVQCGETYTLKFAIADAGDSSFDSGVFLEARSFNSNAVEVEITTLSGDSSIVEGCTSASIEFVRANADSAIAVPVFTGGNAIDGIDYSGLPDTVFFAEGETEVTITIDALEDGIFEPEKDTLIITVLSLNLCGDTIESTGTIFIQEDYVLDIEVADVNVVCPTDSVLLVASADGGNPDYTYTWSNGEVGDSIWVESASSAIFTVYAEDICSAFSDTVDLNLGVNIPPPPMVSVSGPTSFDCVPETLTLIATGSSGTSPYTYLWSNGSGGSSITVALSSDTTFSVTATDACGVESVPFTQTIEQNPVPVPNIQTSADVVLDCPGEDATLTAIASGGNPPYQYTWSNGAGSSSTVTVQPSETTEYVVSITDNCFTGTVEDTIVVTVESYVEPTLTLADTSILCPGDLIIIDAVVSGGNDPLEFIWSTGSDQASLSVNPLETTDYILTVTDDCDNSVQGTVTVDVPEYDELVVSVLNADLINGDTVVICELWADTVASQVTGGLAPYTYNWTGTLIEGVSINNDTAIMTVPYELDPDSSVVEIYSLQVTDQCNEEVLTEIPVEVISCDVLAPSIFNPESNFSGETDFCGNTPQNNVFNLPCLNLYPGNTVTIWDRWGRKVYQTEEYHLNPWDGGNQSTGTFYYVCELPGDVEPVKGFFQLVR